MNTIIYTLSDPRTNQIRYVGKTEKGFKRPLAHWTTHRKRKDHCHAWIRCLLREGLFPDVDVVESFDSCKELNESEILWIGYFRMIGCNLTNMTDGGDGVSAGNIPWNRGRHYKCLAISLSKKGKHGRPMSSECREKIANSLRGKKHSIERCIKIGLSKIGNKNNLGKRRSQKTIAQLRESHLGQIPWNKGMRKEI